MTVASSRTIDLVVNGQPAAVSSRHPHLLAALREELHVTSAKDGCSPQGQCGCCTVLLDGKAIQACVVSMEKAEGKQVLTLEGLATDEYLLENCTHAEQDPRAILRLYTYRDHCALVGRYQNIQA